MRPVILVCAMAGLVSSAEAPSADRVGFPENYRSTFVRIRVSDRADSKSTAIIYANTPAATVHPGDPGPFPYGSILVNEAWSTAKDADGNVVLDEAGHYKLDQLQKIHVMRKEHGFGEAYGGDRSGEWEYVSFAPDGKAYLTPPEKAGTDCARCHRSFATANRDWVFGRYEKH
jgi:hypothetical protein